MTTREEQRDVDIAEWLRALDASWFADLPATTEARLKEAADEITRLRSTSQAGGVREALEDCEAYFDERADADQPAGCSSPIPNEEMSLLIKVRNALASVPTPVSESEGLVQATAAPAAIDGSVTLPVCQWQPIETAPKDGTWVLGFRPTSFREDQIDTWQFVHRSCDPPIWINSADSNDEDEQPTHWMPLPLPPDDRTNASEAQSGSLNQTLPASSVSAPTAGSKILAGLQAAAAGNLARVTIEGQTWVRADAVEVEREATPEEIATLVLKTIQDEREACAKLAETMGGDFIENDATGDGYREARVAIAKRIRSRGTDGGRDVG